MKRAGSPMVCACTRCSQHNEARCGDAAVLTERESVSAGTNGALRESIAVPLCGPCALRRARLQPALTR